MKKLLRFIAYLAVAIAALVFITWKLKSNKKENATRTEVVKESNSGAVPVLISVAAMTQYDPHFDANGNFAPVQQITFLAEAAGQINQLLFKEGDRVTQGQVIARLDDQILQQDLVTAQSSLEQATMDKQRFENALASGGVTQKQVDDVRFQYQQAVARVDQAKKRIADTYIKAPISGVINKRYVELGTYLALGNKIADIVNVDRLKLTVNVPEAQVVTLKVGDKVDVTANVFPETHYSGRVTFIAVAGDANLSYPVDIEINNVRGKVLKAGMYGTAHFILPHMEPMMLVPRSAFAGGVNSNELFVLRSGEARTRKVIAGRIFGDRVEVRTGLQVGDTVITSGQVNLVDGTPVVVQQQ